MIPQMILSILISIALFFAAFHLELETVGIASNLSALGIGLPGNACRHSARLSLEKAAVDRHAPEKAFSSGSENDWTRNTIVTLARTYQKRGFEPWSRWAIVFPRAI